MSTKPSSFDYQMAFQIPNVSFEEPFLRSATAEKNMQGLPKLATGNFAAVCRMQSPTGSWAVRAFLRDVPDLRGRYQVISEYLESRRSVGSSLVGFRYIERGVRVDGELHPVVIMDWVSGDPLDTAIEHILTSKKSLLPLIDSWERMIRELDGLGIAHGDLQHGNVLVSEDRIFLVDYDGMYVPALSGYASHERGHANYQNPARTNEHFDSTLDRFSSLLILIALRALAHDSTLWLRYQMRDDAILFRKADLASPGSSPLFQELLNSGDREVARLTVQMMRTLTSNDPMPSIPTLISSSGFHPTPQGTLASSEATGKPVMGWWRKFAGGSETAVAASVNDVKPQSLVNRLLGWWKREEPGGRERPFDSTVSVSDQGPVGAGWIKSLQAAVAAEVAEPTSGHGADSRDVAEHSVYGGGLNNRAGAHSQPGKQSTAKGPRLQVASDQVVGSRQRYLYHRPNCEWARKIVSTNRVVFATPDEAAMSGYSPCRTCRPARSSGQGRIGSVDTNGAEVGSPQRTKSSDIVTPVPAALRVAVGSIVRLAFDDDLEQPRYYRIVQAGSRASDDEVTEDAPLGKAVLGRVRGNTVSYYFVGTKHTVTIVDIR